MSKNKSHKDFGKRKPPSVPAVPSGQPSKRSSHVALLLMGTLAVGGGAYAMMPSHKCERPPNVAQPSLLQNNADCPPRSSSSSGGSGGSSSGRSSYYGGSSSSGSSSSTSHDSGSHSTQRGGFGSFGHAVGFSGS